MRDDEKAGALRALAEMHGERCPARKAMRDEADALEARASGRGPARVTTDGYRVGWESIFGAPQEVGRS